MSGKPRDPFPYEFVDYDGSVSRIPGKWIGFDFNPRPGFSQNAEDYK